MHKITYVARRALLDGADDSTETATVSAPDASIGTTLYNALVGDLSGRGTLVSIKMVDAGGVTVMSYDIADTQPKPEPA